MKLLMESWRRYLKEEVEGETEPAGGDRVAQAKQLINDYAESSGVSYLKNVAEGITDENLKEIGGGKFLFVYFPTGPFETFKHVKHTHDFTSQLPGSKFDQQYSGDGGLLKLLDKFLIKFGKTNPDEIEGNMKKWFGKDMGEKIGVDSLIKIDEIPPENVGEKEVRETITNKNAIPHIMKPPATLPDYEPLMVVEKGTNEPLRSSEEVDLNKEYETVQKVKTVKGMNKLETSLLCTLLASYGDVDGKELISMIAMWPGWGHKSIRNKKDYTDLGYAFIDEK